MCADHVSEPAQVPVVNLTFDHILMPLIQLSARRAQERAASPERAVSPQILEMDQHVQQLSDLARQLRDLINRINETDPTVLALTQEQPPIIR